MIVFIGLLVGIVLGIVWPGNIPDKFSPYISIAILASLCSVFGAVRAILSKNFKTDIFISGFFGNAILAAILVYIGEKLGMPLHFAAVIFFGVRIFENFAIIRRVLLEKVRVED